MREGTLTLVGVQLTYVKALNTYGVDNIYREANRKGLAGIVIQRGFDIVLQAPIIHIFNSVGDTYASRIIKVWTMKTGMVERWYYQIDKHVSPHFVFLNERWRLWAEK